MTQETPKTRAELIDAIALPDDGSRWPEAVENMERQRVRRLLDAIEFLGCRVVPVEPFKALVDEIVVDPNVPSEVRRLARELVEATAPLCK